MNDDHEFKIGDFEPNTALVSDILAIGYMVGMSCSEGQNDLVLTEKDVGSIFVESGYEYELIKIINMHTKYMGEYFDETKRSFLFYREKPFGLMNIPESELHKFSITKLERQPL